VHCFTLADAQKRKEKKRKEKKRKEKKRKDKKRQEKTRKDYAFRRQFNEKSSVIPGCPDTRCSHDPETSPQCRNAFSLSSDVSEFRFPV